AEAALDRLATDPAFDPRSRWEAEWNLARALQGKNETGEAYARINRLLAERAPGSPLPADLRVQMAWLQARLALDVGQPATALKLVDAMPSVLGAASADLKTKIASTSALLQAQAYFAQNREAEALAVLKRLRQEFSGSDAAVSSYLVEAE